MIAAIVHWFRIGLTCHVETELRNDELKTQVKRKQDGGDLFVQLYTKWRQIYRVSCISCCEILKTFLKLNPQYLTYFNVDLKN